MRFELLVEESTDTISFHQYMVALTGVFSKSHPYIACDSYNETLLCF